MFFSGIQCDEPAAPEFGSVLVVGRNSAAGSRAIFTCKEGREVVGSATSKCLETGEWSFPPPKCERKCDIIFWK
ncbi:hypothetical protein NPIL_108341 [Nephila pilipes]|uniref:Sushi domain-containing protein n=1 Tax=Nephila pilipes TaxID=299642 RepID=A0A8X6I2C6_NEPPI|nr:hypothetical protein NPIL_108341 [Nephila pilipes]